MEGKSGKQGEKKGKKVAEDEKNIGEDCNSVDQKKFRWTLEIDCELANQLRDERSMGNKGDGGWKPCAYNSCSSVLSTQFSKAITPDNARHRVKLWKKYYGIVSDILAQSGFNWDASKQMITVDEEPAWKDYIKSHKDAKQFRWKVIPNWDDIVDLYAKDRATGEGAKTGLVEIEILGIEDVNDSESVSGEDVDKDFATGSNSNNPDSSENFDKKRCQSTSTSVMAPPKKKGGDKKKIKNSLGRMASSLEEYLRSKVNTLSVDEVYEVVSAIPDLEEEVFYKACNWLIENEKSFHLLKKFPNDKKKNYLLTSMPREKK
ncbi:hypothetical protein L1049_019775 [Liquidambar formosana]|uniref:Myb/SANT-like domain-containing protein n=1 Tax=Liquidambar formosana TaxID=63359 RepID=A0AAP0S6C6_LIQFO